VAVVRRATQTDLRSAALLREVCALALATDECSPELAAWCARMMEPGAAERAVRAVERAVDAREPRSPSE
jgi:hypothetical protein